MQKRNVIFFYCENSDLEHEIKFAERECIDPNRTKEWKKLNKLRNESPKLFGKIGWYVGVPELDNNLQKVKDEVYLIEKNYRGQDEGTCVLGMFLAYKKRKIASQIAQGSITNERFLNEVKAKLVEKFNFDAKDFFLEYGRMD